MKAIKVRINQYGIGQYDWKCELGFKSISMFAHPLFAKEDFESVAFKTGITNYTFEE